MISNKLAVAVDKDVFRDYKPDSPDACIVITEYQGSGYNIFAQCNVRSIQILVRDKAPAKARGKIYEIFDLLCTQSSVVTLPVGPAVIELRDTPFKLQVDQKARHEYVFNMGVAICTK